MSELLPNLSQLTTSSGFQFSGVGVDALEADGYTLATIVVDVSGSVTRFRQELEDCVKAVLASCQSSPRSENLLLRLVTFSDNVNEVHGFRLLDTIQLSEVDGSIRPYGRTNLYDAVQSSVEATYDYGTLLTDQDYSVNGVIYIITDGGDTGSRCTPDSIKSYIEQRVQNEDEMESVEVILIGVGYGSCASYLDRFKNDANLDHFLDLEELFANSTPENALAKLTGWISRSISVTSMALQNGNSTPDSSQILLF